jgi:hypothetical protein
MQRGRGRSTTSRVAKSCVCHPGGDARPSVHWPTWRKARVAQLGIRARAPSSGVNDSDFAEDVTSTPRVTYDLLGRSASYVTTPENSLDECAGYVKSMRDGLTLLAGSVSAGHGDPGRGEGREAA